MFICKKENNIHKIEGEKIMLINKICPMCGKSVFLRINSDQEKEFENYAYYDGLIQEKLKSFNDFEREFVNRLLSGMSGKSFYERTFQGRKSFLYTK